MSAVDAARDAWLQRRAVLRRRLWQVLGRPAETVPPAGEVRGRYDLPDGDDVAVERVVFEVEPGQSAPALLYLPRAVPAPYPALVIAMGHGESKTTPGPLLAGPLFAKLGIACLCADPGGEEERNAAGGQGTRAHDAADVSARSRDAGRTVIGKMVWDLMMGLAYLADRPDIDQARLGCAGVSLGGTVAGYLLALEERLRVAVPCGWFFRPADLVIGKDCSRIPAVEMLRFMSNGELLAMAAPHCAVLVANGDADTVIDHDGSGMDAVPPLADALLTANRHYALFDAQAQLGALLEPGGGHRHYYLSKPALRWICRQLGAARMTDAELLRVPEVSFGAWADANDVPIERLYNTEAHFRGLAVPDLGVVPLAPEQRRCLHDSEIGSPRFAIEGWLEAIERNHAHPR